MRFLERRVLAFVQRARGSSDEDRGNPVTPKRRPGVTDNTVDVGASARQAGRHHRVVDSDRWCAVHHRKGGREDVEGKIAVVSNSFRFRLSERGKSCCRVTPRAQMWPSRWSVGRATRVHKGVWRNSEQQQQSWHARASGGNPVGHNFARASDHLRATHVTLVNGPTAGNIGHPPLLTPTPG